jgi:hypothetical protein
MPSTYTLISSNVLSVSAASVTFSAIPSTYTDLVLRMSIRAATYSGATDVGIRIAINADTSTIYSVTNINAASNTPNSQRFTGQTGLIIYGASNGSTTTTNTFSSSEVYIPNYNVAQARQVSSFGAPETNATSLDNRPLAACANLYTGTTAITSLVLTQQDSTNFAAGSSFYLYGIKNS